MANRGIIYQTDKGQFGLAIHKEQHEHFAKIEKVFVHLFWDNICTKPVLDGTGKKVVTLKHISKLKPIGYSD